MHMPAWSYVSRQRSVPAVLSSLKAQNNALHVTTEQVQALQDALAMAQAAQVPRKAEPNQQTPGRLAESALLIALICCLLM